MAENTTADFTIIGGGFAGLAAARRLLQIDPGLKVVLLEAGRVAEGAAGRNSGFMIDIPHDLSSDNYSGQDDQAIIALNRHAQAFASDAVAEYSIPLAYFDRAGKVNGAANTRAHDHNLNYARHLAALGEPSAMLDAQQMKELTGSAYYRSGLFTPGTVMLQPAGFVQGMAAGLIQNGIMIHENTPALAFERSGAEWIVVTPKAKVSTSKIILAANGHLESFGYSRGRLVQLFLFAVMTPELDANTLKTLGGQPRWGITPSDPMGTTVRRIDSAQGGNRIVTRTCAALRPGMEATRADQCRAERVMQRKFDARFPMLAGKKMQYAWAGHLCLSLNGVSVTRQIEDGVYSACVQNGLGTARGTLTGIGAAEMAMGVSSAITRHFSAQSAPHPLPPRPIRQWGANAVLRWKEWRARAE